MFIYVITNINKKLKWGGCNFAFIMIAHVKNGLLLFSILLLGASVMTEDAMWCQLMDAVAFIGLLVFLKLSGIQSTKE